MFPKGKPAPLENLMYFEDMMKSGVFRKCEKGDAEFSKDKKYRIGGCVYKWAGYFHEKLRNPDKESSKFVWASSLFEGWKIVWDERCQSAGVRVYHDAENVDVDVFGCVDEKGNRSGGTFLGQPPTEVKREAIRALDNMFDHFSVLQKRIGMTAEEYKMDLESRTLGGEDG